MNEFITTRFVLHGMKMQGITLTLVTQPMVTSRMLVGYVTDSIL